MRLLYKTETGALSAAVVRNAIVILEFIVFTVDAWDDSSANISLRCQSEDEANEIVRKLFETGTFDMSGEEYEFIEESEEK